MLRILSDLHYRDASSRLRRLEDLQPLLEGVDELWLNGDTCDNQTGLDATQLAEITDFFRSRVPRVRFHTGNHDPDISTDHQTLAANDRLWAFHGDVLFDDIVPWSRARNRLVDRIDAIRAAHPEWDFSTFQGRIACHREACTGFARETDPERRDLGHRLRRLGTEFFPPRQPLAMIRAWRTIADLAADAADRWQPTAQIIVTGHVHFPHIWQRGKRTIINTGAFCGPLGAYTVELSDNLVRVRRVEHRDGTWNPGRLLREIPLAPAPAQPASSAL